MNKLEKLEQEAYDDQIHIHTYNLGEDSLKGLYIDGNIALSDKLETSAEKSCILAEELGHHYTSVGDITDLAMASNRKQERKARLWSYNKQIGLRGLIDAYKHNCKNRHDMAEYLEVTEEFLEEAVACYREKYGTGIAEDGYYIMFIPHLMVGKVIPGL